MAHNLLYAFLGGKRIATLLIALCVLMAQASSSSSRTLLLQSNPGFASAFSRTFGSTLLGKAVTDATSSAYAQGQGYADSDANIQAGGPYGIDAASWASAYVPGSNPANGAARTYTYAICPLGVSGCINYNFAYGAQYGR